MKRSLIAAALLFALTLQVNASTVSCPTCDDFRQRVEDATALKHEFERDHAAAQEVYLERLMSRNQTLVDIAAHDRTPREFRNNAWHIRQFLLDFELMMKNDSLDEASIGIQTIQDKINICWVIIGTALNYIDSCDCDT